MARYRTTQPWIRTCTRVSKRGQSEELVTHVYLRGDIVEDVSHVELEAFGDLLVEVREEEDAAAAPGRMADQSSVATASESEAASASGDVP